MAFKQGNGVNSKAVVNSNVLRHTDGRLYVGTVDGIQSINEDGSNGPLLSNTGSMNPMFTLPHVIIIPGRIAIQSTFAQHSGRKVYELKDHLGNVRAVITDRKFLTLTGTDPKYQAELVTATDYYAYGSPMKGRIYTTQTGSYRFGFNGKENDNEVKGEGNSLDFGERIYDSRLGRFLSLDPLMKKFPNMSPYIFSVDNPIIFIDIKGEHGVIYIQVMLDKKGNPAIDKKTANTIRKNIETKLRSMNVDVKVEIHYSNEVMSRSQFENRKGSDPADSYILVGKSAQLDKARNDAKKKGWQDPGDKPSDNRGLATDKMCYVNIENIDAVSGYDTYNNQFAKKSLAEKAELSILHEDGHPKFANISGNKNDFNVEVRPGIMGHQSGTIMDATDPNGEYTPAMKDALQEKHGKIDSSNNLFPSGKNISPPK